MSPLATIDTRLRPGVVHGDDTGQPADIADRSDQSSSSPARHAPRPVGCARVTFWSACRRWLLIGLAVRLVVAPFTSVSLDVATWTTAVKNAMLGFGLYARPGFSYPPVWGYLLTFGGLVLRHLGVHPGAVAVSTPAWQSLAQQTGIMGASVSTPLATLVLKLPLFLCDVAVAWVVWCLVIEVGGDTSVARRAALAWFLCPLVIWESAVHGAFDTVVALAVTGALLLRVQRRFAWCGALLAVGVLTKVTPAFLAPLLLATCLWPMGRDRSSRPVRDAGTLAVGGVAATVALLLPLLASGELPSMLTDVFARAAVQPSVGGLSLLGVSAVPGLSWIATWATTPGNPLLTACEVADVAVALGAVWWWHRAAHRDPLLLCALTTGVLGAIELIGPLANPQYLLWLLGPLAVLGGWRRSVRRSVLVLSAAGILFELSLFGPLGMLSPSAQAFGVPTPALVTTELHEMAAGQVLGVPFGHVLEALAWALGLLAVTILLVPASRTALAPPGIGPEPIPRPRRRPPIARWGAPTLVAMATAIPLVAGLASGAMQPVDTRIAVSTGGYQHRQVHWQASAVAGASVAVLATADPVDVRRVVLYDDPAFPDSGSSPYQVQGMANHLPVALHLDHVTGSFSVVGARGLAGVLAARPAAGTVVVVASGTLPSTVWSPTADAVVPFMDHGGTLVFGGDIPGFYSVGPASSMDAATPAAGTPVYGCGAVPQPPAAGLSPAVEPMGVAGVAELLGSFGVLTTRWGWQCTADRPSAVARALGLQSATLHSGPTTTFLADDGGTDLGYRADGRTSIAWIPRGAGGLVLFGGAIDAGAMASDIAHLLAAAGARPDTRVVAEGRRTGTVTVAGHDTTRVAVVEQEAGTPLFSAATATVPAVRVARSTARVVW